MAEVRYLEFGKLENFEFLPCDWRLSWNPSKFDRNRAIFAIRQLEFSKIAILDIQL